MGFVDSFNSLKGIFVSVDEEYDDLVEYPQPQPQQDVRPVQQPSPAQKPAVNQYYEDEMLAPVTQTIQTRRAPSNKVMNINTAAVSVSSQATKMVLKRPTKFEEAIEIGAEIRAQKTVFVNLEDSTPDVSKRLFDFLSGVAFAMGGKVEKLAKLTYIFAPFDAELMGEDFENSKMEEIYYT